MSNTVIKKCEICKEDYSIKSSHAHKRRTCSRSCAATLKGIEKSGVNNPFYGKKHSTLSSI